MNFPDPKPSPVDLKLKLPRSWSTLAWKPIEKEVDYTLDFHGRSNLLKDRIKGSAWISAIPRGASSLPRMIPTGWNTFEKDRAFCLEHAQMPLTARTF